MKSDRDENKKDFIRLSSNGNLYYLKHIKVQRGMNNQKAHEVIVYGFNINKQPDRYLNLLESLFNSKTIQVLSTLSEYLIEWIPNYDE